MTDSSQDFTATARQQFAEIKVATQATVLGAASCSGCSGCSPKDEAAVWNYLMNENIQPRIVELESEIAAIQAQIDGDDESPSLTGRLERLQAEQYLASRVILLMETLHDGLLRELKEKEGEQIEGWIQAAEEGAKKAADSIVKQGATGRDVIDLVKDLMSKYFAYGQNLERVNNDVAELDKKIDEGGRAFDELGNGRLPVIQRFYQYAGGAFMHAQELAAESKQRASEYKEEDMPPWLKPGGISEDSFRSAGHVGMFRAKGMETDLQRAFVILSGPASDEEQKLKR